MKRMEIYFLLLVALPVIITGCAQSMAVEVAGDKKGLVVQGKIEAREVDINTKIPGSIEKLSVSEGGEIMAGDILLHISS